MKIKTRFYQDGLYWGAAGEMLNSNETGFYQLLCENRGSMIAIYDYTYCLCVRVQISSWTLEYQIQ